MHINYFTVEFSSITVFRSNYAFVSYETFREINRCL